MFVALYRHLRNRCHEIKKDHVRSLQFKIGDKMFDPALSKSRDFYGLLRSSKATESRGFTKLKSKFSIDDVETKKAFSLTRSCICETYVQCFQFKIQNDILFTNSRLAECHIAAKFNNRKMLETKWKPILNYNLGA